MVKSQPFRSAIAKPHHSRREAFLSRFSFPGQRTGAMAGISLKCGDYGALLKSVEEAQGHTKLTSHSNFFKSTEASPHSPSRYLVGSLVDPRLCMPNPRLLWCFDLLLAIDLVSAAARATPHRRLAP
ncbi:hypothetical protein NL676_016403 [Syzygium grande]|nr:hypothetical protein NL676_016403 [Syzygium grande]